MKPCIGFMYLGDCVPSDLQNQVYITGLCVAHIKEGRIGGNELGVWNWAFLQGIAWSSESWRRSKLTIPSHLQEHGSKSNHQTNPFACLHYTFWLYLQYVLEEKKEMGSTFVFCLLGSG